MNLIHALEPLPASIFLAGPTPRSTKVPSWRPEACRLLEKYDFKGDVMIPEQANGWVLSEYDNQVYWEWAGLNCASVILFWIPRDLVDMPAFTTNVEYGLQAHSQKCVLGFPESAKKMGYLEALAKRYSIPTFNNLDSTVQAAIRYANNPQSFFPR